MADLIGLLKRLAAAEVDFVLVGGLAAVTHGSSLLTQDVDVCIRLGAENLARIQNALKDLKPVHRMSHQERPFSDEPAVLNTFKNIYLDTEIGQLDCLGTILGLGDCDAVQASSIQIQLGDHTVHVLSIDGLITAKSALNRDRDIEAVKQLKEIKKRQSPPTI